MSAAQKAQTLSSGGVQQPSEEDIQIGDGSVGKLGSRVTVQGFACNGTLRWIGNFGGGKPRAGVEMDEPVSQFALLLS